MKLPKNWTAAMMVRRKPDLISAHHVFCLALFRVPIHSQVDFFLNVIYSFVLIFFQVARAV